MTWRFVGTAISVILIVALTSGADRPESSVAEQIWHHRNLGKAFYENPTTQLLAVDEFKKALDLAPDSARERVNYGLALLRAGKTQEGVVELEKAQKQDPRLPHTWFNLGITFKRDSDYERAIQQLEQMVKLVPSEPVSHYNLGYLYKLTGKPELSLQHFEAAAKLNPNLAGPHFQLQNIYKANGRAEEAARELAAFQEIKKRMAGAAVPEDMEWSYFAEIYDTPEPKADDRPPVQLIFKDKPLPVKLGPGSAGLLVLDADGDGRADLLAWASGAVSLLKNGSAPVEKSGLQELQDVVSISAGDFNNDGLADLCVLTTAGAALYENKGGFFQKVSVELPSGRFAKAVWIDSDHDGDQDLFLLGEKSALVRNNGSAGFSDRTVDFPFVPGQAVDGSLYDLIADTSGKDLVIAYKDHPAVLYKDKLAGKYEAITLDELPAGALSILAFDIDNDGWTDLVASYPDKVRLIQNAEGRLQARQSPLDARGPLAFADLENRALSDLVTGTGTFRNQGTGILPASNLRITANAAALATADFNDDGRTDIASIDADGALHLYFNETETANRWLRIALVGIKNPKLAPSAQVEVKAGPWYQKRIYDGVPLLFGVGPMPEADTVRITWPNGLIQNQPRQAAGKAEVIKEAQRLSGSCPMIFTWNGKQFEFVTDVLGVAPLGASSGSGEFFPLDHDEYVQIPGTALAPTNGLYEIRVTEELREVSYLDQIRLIALDHPADVEVFTNEKFKSPPFPDFRLFGVKNRIYPVAAHEDSGRDVLDRVLKKDRVYPDGFERTFTGVASPHILELDFGKAAANNRAVLILNGWVDWPDGSTFLGAAQEKFGGLALPKLQVKDSEGRWQTVVEDMGIPAGKPKTIAVDLTGKFLSASREVRIVTNLCVYWDQAFLSDETSEPQVRMTALDLESADLRFRGFSQPTIDPERRQPESFDYSQKMPLSMWNPTPGLYTRYGNVKPVLDAVDDRFVIMGSGDEVRLLFNASRLTEPGESWKRDFLLLVDGWAKDADPNTAFSQSVEPLPFHGMRGYPYPPGEQFPDDENHRLYRAQYNTRPALRLIRPLAWQRVR